MKFSIEQLNTAYAIMRKCEESIHQTTGLSVRLHILDANILDKTPEQMMAKIASALLMKYTDFAQVSKKADFVDLRFIAISVLKEYYPDLTLKRISALFGGQDHTTILNGQRKAKEYLESGDERFSRKYNIVKIAIEKWLIES